MIRLALQKSGRLNQDSLKLLKDCGISIDNGKDQLKASAHNFPMEVFFLRNGDIPKYIRDGVVDLAIVGENLLMEKGMDLNVIERLGFSKCRVSIAFPKGVEFMGVQDLQGKRIATSYPNTVKIFLEKNNIDGISFLKEEGNDFNFINTINEQWSGAMPFTIIYDKNGNVSSYWENIEDKTFFESAVNKALAL